MRPATQRAIPVTADHDVSAIRGVALTTRSVIEPGLEGYASGSPNAAGACLHASWLLCQTLARFFPNLQSLIRGGGDGDGGVLAPDGNWHGHYWVEVTAPDASRFVVDITADQFGFDSIVVIPLDESRSTYHPGDQQVVDEAVAQLTQESLTLTQPQEIHS